MSETDEQSDISVRLDPLGPEFSEARHGIYLSALERALDHQPTVRNIALAGAYGVGKSSVLGELGRRRPAQVINVSLLTLGAEPEVIAGGADANPAERTTSNRIQKEIVKQLLYQQSPAQATQSRFRRIDRTDWVREALIAGVAGVLALILLYTSGLAVPSLATAGLNLPDVPRELRLATIAVAVVASGGLLVLVARLIARGRIGIEKVAAGPATISLPPRSSSYFDEYLDEIIYFFEVNPKRNLVIIEDLDRFNDPSIYESLRSLNGLLNAAHQLRNRNVRFVYAVRDSVFEKVGRTSLQDNVDDTRAELARANRTKFFELIIPMVPFITHKNARDLLHHTLTDRGHSLSRSLIDLAARHVPDMRLIHNIVNEYEVFKRLLLDVPVPVPELDQERLFAMMLYKNTQATDFEAVRHGGSSLDDLFEIWREFVNDNVDRLRRDNSRLRARLARKAAADDHAEDLGQRLRRRIDAFASAPSSGLASNRIEVEGVIVSDATLQSASFWRQLRATQGSISLLTSQTDPYGANRKMTLSLSAIETFIGASLSDAAWSARSSAADEEALTQNDRQLAFLRRHTWQMLIVRSEFSYDQNGTADRSFRQWLDQLLPSQLLRELVTHGYITSYFPLHVSAFYGQLIRPAAMTYVMRNIDNGRSDAEYPLDPADVDAILADQGRSVLSERSMRNVSILDHLLASDLAAAETIVRALPGDEPDGPVFIERYLSAGQEKSRFVGLLTPYAPNIFSYVAEGAPLEDVERVALLNVAIGHRGQLGYELGRGLRRFLVRHGSQLPALTGSADDASPEQAVQLLVDTDAVIPSVEKLSIRARGVIQGTRAYELTAPNIQALIGSSSLALDYFKENFPDLYQYALDEPETYSAIWDAAAQPGHTVKHPAGFVEVLNDAKNWPVSAMNLLVRNASDGCRVDSLAQVPESAWPVLVELRLAPASLENLRNYLDNFEALDSQLSSLLLSVEALDGIDEVPEADDRLRVALALINGESAVLDDARRVQLAVSTGITGLLATAVRPQSGTIVGRLLALGLIEDDEDAFAARLMVDWPTQEYAILQSTNFPDLAGPETVQPAFIAPLLRSESVPGRAQAALINNFTSYASVPREAFEAMAVCALRNRVKLDAAAIALAVRSGLAPQTVLELMAQVSAADRLSVEELRRLLREMGGKYALIADYGTQRPKFEDSEPLRHLAGRLKSAGVVSGTRGETGGQLRVFLHQAQ